MKWAPWHPARPRALARRPFLSRVAFHVLRWSGLVALALLTNLFFPHRNTLEVPVPPEGTIAERDIVAPFTRTVTIPVTDDSVAAATDSIEVDITSGDRIVAAHEPVTAEAAAKLRALRAELERLPPAESFLRTKVAPVLFNAILLSIFWLLLLLYRWEAYASLRQVLFFTVVFAVVIALFGMAERLVPDSPELMPTAFAAILVTVLYSGRLGQIAATTLAVLLGLQAGALENHALFFGLASGVMAALATRTVRRRTQIYPTIGAIAAAYALAAVTLGLMYAWPPAFMVESMVRGAVATVLSAAVAMMLIPVAEWVTGITTDITLLELADPSRPILRRLATEAPGTYAHSVAMANLCEQACNAIGANGLLARIGCYYHDIGKLVGPKYFAENQVRRINPHDEMRAQDSARLVRSHVTEGLRLGREAGLPPVVLAFIPEHHGTMHLDYFRDRARLDGTYQDAEMDDYRYPGPRPRSVETAVTMLADSAEAALRVLGEPTPERIRSAIEYLIQQKVELGQLKEAPLTLSDLDQVKEEFVRHMTGIYHSRMEYPGKSGGLAALFPTQGAGRE